MKCEFILKTSAYAGKILLESCAEIYRVEDTIERICEHYNMKNINAFVTPSGIFVTIEHEGKSYSRVIRVKESALSLDKIHQVNDLSRKLINEDLPIEEVYHALEKIDSTPLYTKWQKFFACGMIGACFTLIFNGTFQDAITAFFIGYIVYVIQFKMGKSDISSMMKTMFLSAIITFLSLFAVYIGMASNYDAMISGSIMQLLPGLSMTNAIRDSMSGDLLSGITRVSDVIFTAIALALGTVSVLSLWFMTMGGLL